MWRRQDMTSVSAGCDIQTIAEFRKSHCGDGDTITVEAAQETAQQLREGELWDMNETVRAE